MIFHLIIKRRESMLVNINNLILLTFFHVLFDEFSDFLHNEYDFSFFEFVNSISSRVFFQFNVIEAHSRFELVISEKRKYLRSDRNECICKTEKRLLVRYRTGSRASSSSARVSLESSCPGYPVTVELNSRHQLLQ